jgi:hypothetical protein
METTSDAWNGPQPEQTKIAPGGNKPSIIIDNRKKTFYYRPLNKREVEEVKSFSPDKLANYRGEADRELGTKKINGKQARGFVIGTKKINPARPSPGLLEIWLDSETNLPVLIRYEVKTETQSMTGESSDFQWNIDLDPKLFDATPPAGYTDVTPKPPTSDEKVHLIIESLQTYAEASGGRYPQELHFDFHTRANMIKLLGGGDILPKSTADAQAVARRAIKAFERIPEAKRGRALRAFQGFTQIGEIQDYNSDAAYYGKTIGPKDKDKVLFRWKLDDGRYEVIFGDLRSETVTAERLHKLEGK